MCQVLLFALLRLRFSLPHSAGARVYSTTVALACQIRLSLLRFISSALWRFARQTRQSNCHTDPHHSHDALRYKSSSYNTWIRTANPLGSVSLNVLYLSQCVWQHTLVIAISFLRQAQECRLLLLLRKVKFLNLLFHLISPSRSFLRHGERKADKTTAKKLELPACATCVWAIHGN